MDKKCFVCDQTFKMETLHLNNKVNLHVCEKCKGSNEEKEKETDLLEGLAEGFVCGCI